LSAGRPRGRRKQVDCQHLAGEKCRQVECAIDGIGERAGNASLEEIVMLLHTRAPYLGFTTGIDTTEIARTSRLVSRLTG
jgi:2-isopropylmalate synthase